MRDFELKSARFIAADCLKRFVLPGDRVIDATMGNGHDTLMLCNLVGNTGFVTAFDVQQKALDSTQRLLEENGVIDRCKLVLESHEFMDRYAEPGIQAVVFNLGWLPGSDKCIRTHWDSTQTAVIKALHLLAPMGVCVICVYPGHTQGDEERRLLLDMLSSLKPQEYNVLHHRFLNAGAGAPECIVIQKQQMSSKTY